MAAFNDRLKELRETAGMTQEGLARASGLSTSAVSKLEQQDIDPSWSTVLRLAKALGVGVEKFATAESFAGPAQPAMKKPRGR